METRQVVLGTVLLVTMVLAVRGIVALRVGEVGTVARQGAVGLVLLAFGVGLYRRWDSLG
jgi:hypothetical protein